MSTNQCMTKSILNFVYKLESMNTLKKFYFVYFCKFTVYVFRCSWVLSVVFHVWEWGGGDDKYSHVGPGVKYVRYSIQKNSSLAEHIMKRII